MNALLAVAELELRRMIGGRRGIVVAVVLLLAAVLAGVVRAWAPAPPEGMGGWELVFVALYAVVYLQTLVILVPLLQATSLLKDDEEEGTLVYLTTRPISKPAMLLAKFAAMLVFCGGSLLAGSLVFQLAFALAGGDGLPDLWQRWRFVAATGLGALAYGALFTLVGLVSQRGMILGIVYGFLSEFVLVNVPAVINRLTLMHWLRSVALGGEALPEELQDELGFFRLLDLGSPWTATAVLLVVSALCLGLSMLLVSALEMRGGREETG